MTPAGALLAAALYHSLLGYHSTKVGSKYKLEDREEQKARLAVIATDIVESCEARLPEHFTLRLCVGLEATTVKWESGLLKAIHEGTQLGPSGERCLNQLHFGVTHVPDVRWAITREEWEATTGLGLEATRRCTDLGVRVIGWHVHRCWKKWHGAELQMKVQWEFAEYHHPSNTCNSHSALMSVLRAESWRELDAKLERPVTSEMVNELRSTGVNSMNDNSEPEPSRRADAPAAGNAGFARGEEK
jgi:hypothetical protein